MSPFDALLCERSPLHAKDWEGGFKAAKNYVQAYPERAQEVHSVVAQGLPGEATAAQLGLPYSAEWEGFWHGVYGEVEYQHWAN